MTRVGGGYNSGFADNLSFVMTGQEDPPVNAVPLPAAAWMGMSLLGGLGMLRRRLGRHL
jgi:MYXO-CTERM domain-containing protein